MEIVDCMQAPIGSNQEAFGKETKDHAEMMAQVIMGLGRLEAKIDMMMKEDTKEDSNESESE